MYNEVNRRKENSMKKKSPKCVPDDEMSKIANSNSGNTAGPSSSPGTSTTQSGSSIANPEISLAHRNRISEEISCAVCLDLLVRPITLVPCGHSLCHSCWTEAKRMDCPECRLVVRCHVPARQVENVIATLVSIPNFLDEGDKAHYLERTRASNEASVVSKRASRNQRKRRRSGRTTGAARANAGTFSQAHPTGYDPMLAPLPPPFDEIVGVPDGRLGPQPLHLHHHSPTAFFESTSASGAQRPIRSTSTLPSRQRMTTVAITSSSRGLSPSPQAHPAGGSAADAICID